MVEEAEKNAAADKEMKEKVEVKNQADALVYQTRKQLEEMGDANGAITENDKSKVDNLLTQLEQAVKGDDFETMKKLNKEVEEAMKEIGQKVYSQAGVNGNKGPDADFIETDFSTEK